MKNFSDLLFKILYEKNSSNDQSLSFETFKSDDYISVELGRALLSKEELEVMKKDSAFELDTYTGEACKITRNGKIVAEGKICIADTNFAIRITKVY